MDFTAATTSCLADNLEALELPHGIPPESNEGFWYLVRAVQGTTVGTFDSGGSGQPETRDPEINICP